MADTDESPAMLIDGLAAHTHRMLAHTLDSG